MTDYGKGQWIQYSLKINTRKIFWEFIQAVEKEEGLFEEVEKIQKQIDGIILREKNEQFIKELKPGMKLSLQELLIPQILAKQIRDLAVL